MENKKLVAVKEEKWRWANVIVEGECWDVATVYCAIEGDDENLMKTAQLLAAAPELLQSVEELRNVVEHFMNMYPVEQSAVDAIHRANLATAKANGLSPFYEEEEKGNE
jgi:hypothetical protein